MATIRIPDVVTGEYLEELEAAIKQASRVLDFLKAAGKRVSSRIATETGIEIEIETGIGAPAAVRGERGQRSARTRGSIETEIGIRTGN
jgi:hypothetical protein